MFNFSLRYPKMGICNPRFSIFF